MAIKELSSNLNDTCAKLQREIIKTFSENARMDSNRKQNMGGRLHYQ